MHTTYVYTESCIIKFTAVKPRDFIHSGSEAIKHSKFAVIMSIYFWILFSEMLHSIVGLTDFKF